MKILFIIQQNICGIHLTNTDNFYYYFSKSRYLNLPVSR